MQDQKPVATGMPFQEQTIGRKINWAYYLACASLFGFRNSCIQCLELNVV